MAFILFLTFIVVYYNALAGCNIGKNISYKDLVCFSMPVIVCWVLFIGGQYYVGTDYSNYIDFFSFDSSSFWESKYEYCFSYLIKFCQFFGIYGQGILFVLSLLWIIILLYVFYFLSGRKLKYISLLFCIYILFSSSFNNQFNLVRQYTAIYFFTLAVCCWHYNKLRPFIIYSVLAITSHFTALPAVILFLLVNFAISKYQIFSRDRVLVHLLFVSIGVSFIVGSSTLVLTLINFLSGNSLFYEYSQVFDTQEPLGMASLITKYVYLPVVFMALKFHVKMQLSEFDNKLFVLGIISYSLKILLFSIPYLGRMSNYFEILMCIPVFFLLRYLLNLKVKTTYIITLTYLFLLYFAKVTLFATAEYDYNSIFFQ